MPQKEGEIVAKLTAKQQRFCDEYLIDLNATQAAIRAGYSAKTAAVIATENLRKPNIREYIDERMKEKEAALVADQDEVLRYLTSVMRREYCENIVVTLSEERTTYVPDANGTMRKQTIKNEVPQVVEIPAQLRDANKAAELLGRAYGIYTEKVSMDVKPVVISGDDGLED
jgi:phage terminase small subunit